MRLPVIGGPLCGLTARYKPAGRAYLDNMGRAWAKPGTGRHLYTTHGSNWKYAGGKQRVCDGCAALVPARQACPLCGKVVNTTRP